MKRLLIIYDSPGWALHRRALALQKYADPDWEVDIVDYHASADIPFDGYSVVFSLTHFDKGKKLERIMQFPGPPIGVISWICGPGYLADIFPKQYKIIRKNGYMVINSLVAWKHYGKRDRTCNISNGIDLEVWGVDVEIARRRKRVLWTGNIHSDKEKGWQTLAKPARHELELLGFECSFRPYDKKHVKLQEWAYPTRQQRQWYNDGAIYLVTSKHEGTPNVALEAMACGCAIVSTRVGNLLEMSDECYVPCEETVESVVTSVRVAWRRLEQLTAAGLEEIAKWSYNEPGNRAHCFFDLFDCLLDGEVPEPYTYQKKPWKNRPE